jgi:hypothetical protein
MSESVFPKIPKSADPVHDEPLVYHYASAAAALGVVKNREVWGSKIQFLNDDQEFREYLNFLVRCAEDNIVLDDVSKGFCDELIDRIDRIRHASIYVASFSEEGDKLSQWRGYCPDGGYAIGFRRTDLERHFHLNGMSFRKAIYGLPGKEDVIIRLRDLFESYRRAGLTSGRTQELDEFFGDYILEVSESAPNFKHVGFQEENEWRVYSGLVAWDDANVDVVPVRGALRPIYKFKLPTTDVSDALIDMALDTVRVGPGKDLDLRLDAMRILLRRNRIHYRILKDSTLPYNAR